MAVPPVRQTGQVDDATVLLPFNRKIPRWTAVQEPDQSGRPLPCITGAFQSPASVHFVSNGTGFVGKSTSERYSAQIQFGTDPIRLPGSAKSGFRQLGPDRANHPPSERRRRFALRMVAARPDC
jgi:hypothetical protein